MDPLLPPLLLVVLLTSAVSGAFGMAGGMLLMGVCAALLPVPAAMAVHGAVQSVANGSRALILVRSVHAPTVARYAVGAAAAAGLHVLLRAEPDRATLLLLLGAVPIAARLLPRLRDVSVDRPLCAVVCGGVVTATQLSAGVSGPLLDVFFLPSALPRRAVVATKAVTQCAGHLLKFAWYGSRADAALLAPEALLPLAAAVLAGTLLGTRLLDRLGERDFRRWSGRLVGGLSALYLAQGIHGLWAE